MDGYIWMDIDGWMKGYTGCGVEIVTLGHATSKKKKILRINIFISNKKLFVYVDV